VDLDCSSVLVSGWSLNPQSPVDTFARSHSVDPKSRVIPVDPGTRKMHVN
jgi:hypothetical protein